MEEDNRVTAQHPSLPTTIHGSTHSFFYSLHQRTFIEHLLCAGHIKWNLITLFPPIAPTICVILVCFSSISCLFLGLASASPESVPPTWIC